MLIGPVNSVSQFILYYQIISLEFDINRRIIDWKLFAANVRQPFYTDWIFNSIRTGWCYAWLSS